MDTTTRGRSRLGLGLAARSAPDAVIDSKWGYRYVGDWRLEADVHEVKDHSQTAFAEQWQLTRALLGDRLAIYHVHSLTPDSPALTDRDLHRSLAGRRDQGHHRATGREPRRRAVGP